MTALAVDASVAVPLVVKSHPAHLAVTAWLAGREVALAGHALAETYSVLTRIPADSRLSPADAAAVVSRRFVRPLLMGRRATIALVDTLGRAGVSGGATYDALVALAAREHDCVLATRDARALPVYQALGVDVEVVG